MLQQFMMGAVSAQSIIDLGGVPSDYLMSLRLDGDATDETGNNDGTATNVDREPVGLHEVARFNGSSSYLSIPDSVDFTLDDFAFSFPVYFNVLEDNRVFYQYDAGSGDGFHCGVNAANDKFRFVLLVWGAAKIVYSDDAMVDDTWYHVVVVRESGVLRVYMDAVEQASTQTLSGEINSNGTVRVSRDNSNTKHIEWMLALLYLYNRALSQAEITALKDEAVSRLYLDAPAVPQTNLVHEWLLNTTLKDTAGSMDLTGTGIDYVAPTGVKQYLANFDRTAYTDDWEISELYTGQNYTISCVFKFDVADATTQFIFAHTNHSLDRMALILRGDWDLTFGHYTGSWTSKSVAFSDTSSFHHIVITRTSWGVVVAELDGVEMTWSVDSSTSSTTWFNIGARTTQTSPMDGLVARFRIYDDVLDATKRAELRADAQYWFNTP